MAAFASVSTERAKDAHMVNVNNKGIKTGWKREGSRLGQFKCIYVVYETPENCR